MHNLDFFFSRFFFSFFSFFCTKLMKSLGIMSKCSCSIIITTKTTTNNIITIIRAKNKTSIK